MSKRSRFIAGGMLSALTAGSLALAATPAAAEEPEPAAAEDPIYCPQPAFDEPAMSTSGEPTDPCGGPSPDPSCFFQAPDNGFSWSMEKRFTPTIAGFKWNAAGMRYDPSHVHLNTWKADFNACRTFDDQGRSSKGLPTPAPTPWSAAGRRPRSRAAC